MFFETEDASPPGVDKGLINMFIRMTPEERIEANDDAVRTILELRDAYKRQKNIEREPR